MQLQSSFRLASHRIISGQLSRRSVAALAGRVPAAVVNDVAIDVVPQGEVVLQSHASLLLRWMLVVAQCDRSCSLLTMCDALGCMQT